MAPIPLPGLLQSSQEDPDDPLLGGRGFWQYLGSMLSHVPSSTVQVGKDLASMLNPKTHVLLRYVVADPELRSQVWEALKSDYESPQAILEKLRPDPVGIASVIAGVLMGGGVVVKKAAGLLGDVSNVAKTVERVAGGVERVGEFIDPLTQGVRGARFAATQGVPGAMGGVGRYSAASERTWVASVLEQNSYRTVLSRWIN